MKNIFKFAAMAFAAVVLAGGATSCDNKDEKEPLTIDGKQWEATWDMMYDVPCIFDFGLTKEGTFYFAYDTSGMEGPGWMPYYYGTYTITETDATSGTINVMAKMPYTDMETPGTITYSELTENSVKITCEFTQQTEGVVYTLVTENKSLVLEGEM